MRQIAKFSFMLKQQENDDSSVLNTDIKTNNTKVENLVIETIVKIGLSTTDAKTT